MSTDPQPVEVLVLDDEVPAREVSAVMAELGWVRWTDEPRSHWGERMVGWAPADDPERDERRNTYLRENHITGVRAVLAAGTGGAAVAAQLADRLPHHSEADLLTAATEETDPVALVRALHRLAVFACPVLAWFAWREPDARYLAAWRRLLAHPEPVVRRVAIIESSLLPWREVDDLLADRVVAREDLVEELAWVLEERRRRAVTDPR